MARSATIWAPPIASQLPSVRRSMKTLAVFVWMAVVPTCAFAQGAIAGVVRSSSIPVDHATVEARSAALIEKVRTTSTDANGRYRIEHLPPGTYDVTVNAGAGTRHF